MQEQVDDFTGVSSKVIIESKDPALRPQITISEIDGDNESRSPCCPVGAYLSVNEGDEVTAGQVVAKIPREASQDEGHHRRSAAGGRALRGEEAEGVCRGRRDRRHRVLRSRLARQAPRDRDARRG